MEGAETEGAGQEEKPLSSSPSSGSSVESIVDLPYPQISIEHQVEGAVNYVRRQFKAAH